ncbi:PH domain-containing protein [Streptomyces sp. NPDC059080]|uniref:PH domain-containing protein n=1 Tax=Streptomyces sp. NPDC059080 TaxID=3346718 RepID=UPI00369356CD
MTPTTPPPPRDGGWRRTHPRTLLVHATWPLPPLTSLAAAAVATGGRIPPGTWIALAALTVSFAVVTAVGAVRWARTEFRVTGAALEVRTGVLTRRLRTVPLDRIRTVDLTATPLHRVLRLTALRAGTAGDGSGVPVLDALPVAEAGRLRGALLARASSGAATDDPVLARFSPRWLWYAPLTFWVVGGVLIAAGTVHRVLHGMGVDFWELGFVQRAFAAFGTVSPWLTVPAALLVLLAAGAVGAVALYAENWWDHRLEWADASTLRVRRGLFTTRTVTVGRARLRGVLLREPLLLRAGGGAAVRAVAGGLGDRDENRARSGLLPPAPRALAVRVAGGALRAPFPDPPLPGRGVPATLVRHPRAALRRRRLRGLLWVTLPGTALSAGCGVAFAPVLLPWAGAYAVVSAGVAWWAARAAYRALGHGLCGGHLVVRSGVFSRDTLALERSAVAAWTFSSTPFGRRAGLVTLTAAFAAGEGRHRIPDLAAARAPGFAAAAAPGIVEEFLVGADGGGRP